MSALNKPRPTWRSVPSSWVAILLLVAYWVVLFADGTGFGKPVLDAPIRLLKDGWFFGLPVAGGLVLIGYECWKVYVRKQSSWLTIIFGVLLFLSFPLLVVMTAVSLYFDM